MTMTPIERLERWLAEPPLTGYEAVEPRCSIPANDLRSWIVREYWKMKAAIDAARAAGEGK